MEITNAQYRQFKDQNTSINCDINGKFHSVPLQPGNRHYDEIMKQVADGELTIADAE